MGADVNPWSQAFSVYVFTLNQQHYMSGECSSGSTYSTHTSLFSVISTVASGTGQSAGLSRVTVVISLSPAGTLCDKDMWCEASTCHLWVERETSWHGRLSLAHSCLYVLWREGEAMIWQHLVSTLSTKADVHSGPKGFEEFNVIIYYLKQSKCA